MNKLRGRIMKKHVKFIMAFLIISNLFFITTDAYVIQKKGGINWVYGKINAVMASDDEINKYSDYYYIKSLIYDSLDKNSNAIVFLGDSITDGYEWGEYFKNYNIQNRGINGDTLAGVLDRVDTITKENPDSIFIMIGINDFRNGKTVDYIIKQYKILLQKIQKDSPNTKIYIQSVLPVNIKMANYETYNNKNIDELNGELTKLENENIKYINIYDSLKTDDNQLNEKYTYDGIHLNGTGYQIWINLISKYVKE